MPIRLLFAHKYSGIFRAIKFKNVYSVTFCLWMAQLFMPLVLPRTPYVPYGAWTEDIEMRYESVDYMDGNGA